MQRAKGCGGDYPEQNVGTILESNSEHLPVLKALRGDNPELNAGKIHAKEKLLRGDNIQHTYNLWTDIATTRLKITSLEKF